MRAYSITLRRPSLDKDRFLSRNQFGPPSAGYKKTRWFISGYQGVASRCGMPQGCHVPIGYQHRSCRHRECDADELRLRPLHLASHPCGGHLQATLPTAVIWFRGADHDSTRRTRLAIMRVQGRNAKSTSIRDGEVTRLSEMGPVTRKYYCKQPHTIPSAGGSLLALHSSFRKPVPPS